MTSPQAEIINIINSINSGDPSGALAKIEAFGPSTPAELWYPKAIALAKLSRIDEAIRAARKMAEQLPSDPRALGLLEELQTRVIELDKPSAAKMLSKARELMAAGQNYQAKEVLIEAKALRQPVEGLDYTRAVLFKGEGRLGDARECLNEELRFFPNNSAAAALLAEVRQLEATNRPQIDDPEFYELLNSIRPYSMLPEERLYRVFALARQVAQSPLSGNFVECGVAGGGSSAMMAALMRRYRKTPGTLFACDSFSGMPDPTEHDTVSGQAANDTGWGAGTCAAPDDSVREISAKLGCSSIVKPVKGYFENTLPPAKAEIGKIALLHADCDWYSSLMTIFNELYDQVEPGGVIILDDYGYWEGIKKATDEFFAKRGINPTVQDLGGSAWFQKPY
jgi:tetratricopeptide (TPR) repeat protein